MPSGGQDGRTPVGTVEMTAFRHELKLVTHIIDHIWAVTSDVWGMIWPRIYDATCIRDLYLRYFEAAMTWFMLVTEWTRAG